MSQADHNHAARYRAPALDKGLDILEILASHSEPLSRAEIGALTGRSASEIYRMLERLVARGYVARGATGDRYALTMRLFVLANSHPPLRRLVAQAQPMMDAFARETRQSCHLVMPEAGAGVVVAQASPVDNWELRVRIGAQLALTDTSSGLTLLAFQDQARRVETFARWGCAGLASQLAQQEAELAAIRKDGFRRAPSAQLVGVTDLSVPVTGPSGDAEAVLTCAYIEHPGDRAAGGRQVALDLLRNMAAQLSQPGLPS
ncbi:MAG: IclR family transcriptional regulator [Paracoccus sp. (in: a-proteobacteria)]|nr:IclR family transcriptional regulator [Paracoccus sp. (in: a-proteobacteria)]